MARWAIILAGGEGSRIRPFIEECLGFYYPKQYCAFCGSRSMLEHTIERARRLVGDERIVTVVGKGHCRYFNEERLPGQIIEQPEARGTALGVLLPATHILAQDPEATAIVFPSDHFIFPIDGIVAQIEMALTAAEFWSEKLILLGAAPECAEPDYGWIEPGPGLDFKVQGQHVGFARISSFREKPSSVEAAEYFAEGHLWNTMIVAGKIKTLWAIAQDSLPRIQSRFEILLGALKSVQSGGMSSQDLGTLLSELYACLPEANFSESFLAKYPDQSVVLPLKGVFWSDWGRPERVLETLRLLGKPFTLAEFHGPKGRRQEL